MAVHDDWLDAAGLCQDPVCRNKSEDSETNVANALSGQISALRKQRSFAAGRGERIKSNHWSAKGKTSSRRSIQKVGCPTGLDSKMSGPPAVRVTITSEAQT